jgi:hypothetical protein
MILVKTWLQSVWTAPRAELEGQHREAAPLGQVAQEASARGAELGDEVGALAEATARTSATISAGTSSSRTGDGV